MITEDCLLHGCGHCNRRIPWPHNEWNTTPLPFPTTLVHLLHHNRPPSELEASRVKTFKQAVQYSLLQQNEDEIQRLQHELDRLKDTQTTLKKQVFACDVILSPFRRLPLDIIHAIIAQCPTVYPSSASTSPRAHLPSILAQTSRVWRHAVRGTSRLWQDLHFVFEDWGTGADYIIDRLALFTRLSRSLPLSIRIDKHTVADEIYDWAHQVSFLQWLVAIWQDRDRMTRLCLTGVNPSVVVHQWKVGVDSFPDYPPPAVKSILFLEEDRVHGDGLENKTVTSLLEVLPQLQHVWLGCRVSSLRMTAHLSDKSLQPWARLKTLYMGTSFSTLDWRGLLRTCPNLEAAFVHIHHKRSQYGQVPGQVLVHQNLKELLMRFTVYNDNVLAPFCGLDLPNMHTLEVTFVHSKLYRNLHPDLKQQLSSTFPSLKSLCVHETSHIDNSFKPMFPFFLTFGSTITSLRISLSFRHVLLALPYLFDTNRKSKTRRLPHLETLILDFGLEPALWKDELSDQLPPLFINARRSLVPQTYHQLSFIPCIDSSNYSSPASNLQSMTVCLTLPPRPNQTRKNRKIIRFFVGLKKRYEAERVGIRVKVEESPNDSFEPYERRFMERFPV